MTRHQPFKVVIVYENFISAVRATELSERLAIHLMPGINIASKIWKFDFLRYPVLRDEAADDAVAAGMIIVSVQATLQLPFHVRTWIESWAPYKRKGATAFVALLDHEEEVPGESPSLHDYLRATAAKAGMGFFFKAGGWQPERLPPDPRDSQRQSEFDPALFQGALHPDRLPVRGWGINE